MKKPSKKQKTKIFVVTLRRQVDLPISFLDAIIKGRIKKISAR